MNIISILKPERSIVLDNSLMRSPTKRVTFSKMNMVSSQTHVTDIIISYMGRQSISAYINQVYYQSTGKLITTPKALPRKIRAGYEQAIIDLISQVCYHSFFSYQLCKTDFSSRTVIGFECSSCYFETAPSIPKEKRVMDMIGKRSQTIEDVYEAQVIDSLLMDLRQRTGHIKEKLYTDETWKELQNYNIKLGKKYSFLFSCQGQYSAKFRRDVLEYIKAIDEQIELLKNMNREGSLLLQKIQSLPSEKEVFGEASESFAP